MPKSFMPKNASTLTPTTGSTYPVRTELVWKFFMNWQCSEYVTVWYGSGFSDPNLWLTDPDADPDPALFVSDLQDANKKKISPSFYSYSFLKVHLPHSLKIKSHRSHKTVEKSWLFIFCLSMEGSGSVQINYGSGCGSRRPKNIRILRIWIRRRIRNTDEFRAKSDVLKTNFVYYVSF
jgi:hypothetical protein